MTSDVLWNDDPIRYLENRVAEKEAKIRELSEALHAERKARRTADARYWEISAMATRLRKALGEARIEHLSIGEDPYYSCELARDEDGNYENPATWLENGERVCTCGAAEHNAKIDAALDNTTVEVSATPTLPQPAIER